MSAKPAWSGTAPVKAAPDRPQPQVFLIIDAPEALALIAGLPYRPAVVMTRFAMLDGGLLARVQPDCIILPLLKPGFDIAQALHLLTTRNYGGKVCAISQTLPDRAMVEAELRALAPALKLCLIEIPAP